ncbi:hemogen isoform 1-T1 [Dugong dugon]
MDLGKDQTHVKLHQTPASHQQENHAPEVIGTWCLRNREHLRKRKVEAEEKQTSQWLFGEHNRGKRQRTGKGNERCRKRQQTAELKVDPWPQVEKEMMEKAVAPTEQETEPPGSVTEALPPRASEEKAMAEKSFSEICQESIIHQENCSEYEETGAQNHPSETCQDMTEPEDLSPKMCQEIAVLQDHPSKMYQDMAEPEDLSSKMCQRTSVVTALPSKTSEDTAALEGCSPEVYPKPDVPKGYPLETDQKMAEPKEWNSEPDQETAENKSFFPKIQDGAVPKDLSTKTYPGTTEPKYFSHKTYKEVTMSKTPSPKTIRETPGPEEHSPEVYQETPGPEEHSPEVYQETPGPEEQSPEVYQEKRRSEEHSPEVYQETPGPEEQSPEVYQEKPRSEEYSPEIYQETSGPEDLSTKTCTNKNVSKECFPEPYQETGGPEGWDPITHQEDAKDFYTFPREMKEKSKAEKPANLNSPQEDHPEDDIYSFVLF